MSDLDAADHGAAGEGSLERIAHTAILTSYYGVALGAAERARDRARNGQTVVTTIAGAAMAVFTGTALADRPSVVRFLGAGAILAWLLASGCFAWAVSGPAIAEPPSGELGIDEFARTVLDRAKADRGSVDRWLRPAVLVTLLALLLTGVTFTAYAVVDEPSAELDPATARLVLVPSAAGCDAPGALTGTVLHGLHEDGMASQLELRLSDGRRFWIRREHVAALCLEARR